jgi:hypothetical protein
LNSDLNACANIPELLKDGSDYNASASCIEGCSKRNPETVMPTENLEQRGKSCRIMIIAIHSDNGRIF